MGRCFTAANPAAPFGTLNPLLQTFNNLSLAESTKACYRSGVKQFYEFCHGFKVHDFGPILPTNETTLCYFVTYLAKTLKLDTIKTYLAAVRDLHIRNGFSLDIEHLSQLQYTLRGIKRHQRIHTRVRHPILLTHLEIFFENLQPNRAPSVDNAMIWASFCLAFFGFLRISEFTCDRAFNPETNLALADVTIMPTIEQPTYLCINIKKSKTDQFKRGVSLTIGKSGSHVCAVTSMPLYLRKTKPPPGPLFVYANGQPLSRVSFTSELRNNFSLLGFKLEEFASHSFRRGAATTAAAAGMPPWLIQTMGRWSSECYKRYIELPKEVLATAAQDMLSSSLQK